MCLGLSICEHQQYGWCVWENEQGWIDSGVSLDPFFYGDKHGVVRVGFVSMEPRFFHDPMMRKAISSYCGKREIEYPFEATVKKVEGFGSWGKKNPSWDDVIKSAKNQGLSGKPESYGEAMAVHVANWTVMGIRGRNR